MINHSIARAIGLFFSLALNLLSFWAVGQTEGEFFRSFDGTKIYYEVKGKGEPVLLIHGFIVNSESWKRTELYTDLLAAGYQVILLDQRGNGKSDKPQDPQAYEKDAEAKDIMALATQLGLADYHAVGYSRGAIIASRLLLMDSRVKSAVLGGMGSDFTNPDWPRRILFYRALMGEDVPELAGMVKYVQDSKLDQRALAYLQKEQPSTTPDEFKTVTKPVLVICGDQDADNGSSKELAAMVPRSLLVRTPGNHNNALRTREFSEAVRRFIK